MRHNHGNELTTGMAFAPQISLTFFIFKQLVQRNMICHKTNIWKFRECFRLNILQSHGMGSRNPYGVWSWQTICKNLGQRL